MTSKAALKSYRAGWKRSAKLHRQWAAEDQRREDGRNAAERAINSYAGDGLDARYEDDCAAICGD